MKKDDATHLSVSQRHKVRWPTLSELVRDPAAFVAFGFGIGLVRPGSGTWGTLLAALIWWAVQPEPTVWLGIALAVAFVFGCWICERTGSRLGTADHVGMVWDEMVALWLLLWILPQTCLAFILAIVFFRVFDVAKPYPIHQLEAMMPGGVGVMVDDVVAAIYAWVVIAIILAFVPV
ncbi:phosphatidylglycerophosphatase A [Orrella sp. 11846]|uniref:phosphatidylglycerophosphatase A family protein n=1 Tax=Orrella sp. 11846 TaxID=3409913 RepID=UPI003B5AAAFE